MTGENNSNLDLGICLDTADQTAVSKFLEERSYDLNISIAQKILDKGFDLKPSSSDQSLYSMLLHEDVFRTLVDEDKIKVIIKTLNFMVFLIHEAHVIPSPAAVLNDLFRLAVAFGDQGLALFATVYQFKHDDHEIVSKNKMHSDGSLRSSIALPWFSKLTEEIISYPKRREYLKLLQYLYNKKIPFDTISDEAGKNLLHLHLETSDNYSYRFYDENDVAYFYEVIQFLVQVGVDPYQNDKFGNLPIDYASKKIKGKVNEILLETKINKEIIFDIALMPLPSLPPVVLNQDKCISPATLQISGPLFEAVQKEKIFKDCKTFVDLDLIKGVNLQQIYDEYIALNTTDTFNTREFIHRYFMMPEEENTSTPLAPKHNMMSHIHQLWNVLSRQKDENNNTTRIPLPFPYVVPGGRFREVYYWDSYFTSIGLALEQRYDLIENMLKNFKYLVDTFGFVPNGNRIYYKTRSQPPVLSCIVDIFVKHRGNSAIKEYLPTLEKEYAFWMRGKDKVSADLPYDEHVVRMPCGSLLNRYYDPNNTPRPESYREDIAAFETTTGLNRKLFYQHIRAACESGWDFSSRWLADITSLSSIETLNIVPVDLNMWLYLLEFRIGCYHQTLGQDLEAHHFISLAVQRRMAINKYCWSHENGFYFDYNLRTKRLSSVYALSGCTPLFAHMSNQEQAKSIANVLREKFLKVGGLVTTLHTLQQWDAPNGWAPLQYLAVQGLLNYQQCSLANTIMERWLKTNQDRYNATGKMLEKYNVCDPTIMASGGEYPSQDGFGWTNAIALKFSALTLQNQPQVNDINSNSLTSATTAPVLHLQASANKEDNLSIKEQRKFHFFSY